MVKETRNLASKPKNNNWMPFLFIILLIIPIPLGYFTNWPSKLLGLIYYVFIFIYSNLVLVIPYFDRIEKEGKTNILHAMFVSTATIALFVSIFLVIIAEQENNLSMRNYLCREYQDNFALSKTTQFSLPDQFYNTHALERYFLSNSTIFDKEVENDLNQDYLKLVIANNKIDRINNFYNSVASSDGYLNFQLEEEELWKQFEILNKNFNMTKRELANKLNIKELGTDHRMFNDYISRKGEIEIEQLVNDIKNPSVKFYFRMHLYLSGWAFELNSRLEKRIEDMKCL